tara:strand:- start:1124 stop:1789 length:666 start_codon:yes stop_codon:yes gene_type:complete
MRLVICLSLFFLLQTCRTTTNSSSKVGCEISDELIINIVGKHLDIDDYDPESLMDIIKLNTAFPDRPFRQVYVSEILRRTIRNDHLEVIVPYSISNRFLRTDNVEDFENLAMQLKSIDPPESWKPAIVGIYSKETLRKIFRETPNSYLALLIMEEFPLNAANKEFLKEALTISWGATRREIIDDLVKLSDGRALLLEVKNQINDLVDVAEKSELIDLLADI